MIRRFNYTGRQRILTEHVSIHLTQAGPARTFAAQLTLGDYDLPPKARVYLEAFEKTAIMRFPFGSVADLSEPDEVRRRLTEFEGSDAFNFRVKVVDASGSKGRILAESGPIRPVLPEAREERRRSLLHVRYGQLGEQVWMVEFPESTQEPVELLVNNLIPDKTAFVRSPEFTSLVLPAVLREILVYVLVGQGYRELDDTSDWKSDWLSFAKTMVGTEPPGDEEGQEEAFEWIDRAVDAFCKRHEVHTRYSKLQDQS
jgi:hypothetical protein